MKWITRERIKVDRTACPWLITTSKKFVLKEEQTNEKRVQTNQNPFKLSARPIGAVVLALTIAMATLPARAGDTLTERNKSIVRDFYKTVLIYRDVDAAPRFLRSDYIQHNPQVPTGLKGFMDTFRERFAHKLPSDYKRELLNVIGDKDMVVTYVPQTWTGSDGQHHQALGFDMFRVQDGMIAEHWDAD